MKKSKNEVEFVEFKNCRCCWEDSDVFCLSCQEWYCSHHLRYCIQCRQEAVCFSCYKEDKCCLVRPWGEKEKKHLCNFYSHKFVDDEGMVAVARLRKNSLSESGNELRKEVFKRSLLRFVDNFDSSFVVRENVFEMYPRFNAREVAILDDFVARCFPRISKYVEEKKTRLKFLDFMDEIISADYALFGKILVYSEDRDQLISLLEQSIRENGNAWTNIVDLSLRANGKALFHCLKNRGLLSWERVKDSQNPHVHHIDAIKWVESNGIDLEKNLGILKGSR